MELSLLVNQFDIEGRLVTIVPTGNGNVNDTYLAVYRNTYDEHQVIMQRINRNVFPQPEAIMGNLHKLAAHSHPKLEREADHADRIWQMPQIIRSRTGGDYVLDEHNDVWRVITKIPSATAYDEAQGTEHAMECGAVLGHFHWTVADLPPETMVDPLPGFHITPRYLAKYDEILDRNPLAKERLAASMYAKTSSARGTPRNEKAEIKKKLDAGAYKTPQERENAKQRMHELWLEIDKLQNECVRLKERAATLYLPNDIPDIIPEPPPPDVDGSQQRGNNE